MLTYYADPERTPLAPRHPTMSAEWRQRLLSCSLKGDEVMLDQRPNPEMRTDLISLFDRAELEKYLTSGELANVPAPSQEKA